MQNKLQELTDQLYKEGLSRGREEGDRYLQEARSKADAMVGEAEQKAARIVEDALHQAEALKAKAEADIRMASAQTLQAVKKDVENLVIAKIGKTEALGNPDFLKQIILKVAERFSATESADISLVLPEQMRSQLEPWVAGELSKALASPVSAQFSKKAAGGFTIGPKDGSYFISLTDKTFDDLIAEYLRPVTRKLLFGE